MNGPGRSAREGRALQSAHPSWRDHIAQTHGELVLAVAMTGQHMAAHHFLRATLSGQLGLGEPVPEPALDWLGACVLGWSVRDGDDDCARRLMETLEPGLCEAFLTHRRKTLPTSERPMVFAATLMGARTQSGNDVRLAGMLVTALAARCAECRWDFQATSSTQDRGLVLECRALISAHHASNAMYSQSAAWVAWAEEHGLTR